MGEMYVHPHQLTSPSVRGLQGMAALASLAGSAASNGSIGQTGPQANSSWTTQRGPITLLKVFCAP
jgi:hypothetical protein